jgi:hypothetical protein
MSVPFAAFGPGILIVTRTDVSPVVPINVGFAQELTLDFSGNTKQLYGQKQFPLVAARGTIKATGKWKSAVISGIAWNNAFYGMTSFTAGGISWNVDSTYTTSTAVATVQVGSSLTFEADLGVKYAANSLPLQRVATGSETTGKYSVASTQAGLYTFGGGDTTTATNLKVTFTNTNGLGHGAEPAGHQPDDRLHPVLPARLLHAAGPADEQSLRGPALRLRRRQTVARVQARRLHDAGVRLRPVRRRQRPRDQLLLP